MGGESLRFSEHTPAEVEVGRVVPVIEALAAELDVPVAVDTFKPEVARAGIAAGAAILNDPTGLREPAMAAVAAEGGVGVVLTHFFGPPKVRPTSFPDVDVPDAVVAWAREALAAGRGGGDPAGADRRSTRGVGLGKSPPQDLDLLRRIDEVAALGRPVFVPISNKKVLGALTGAPGARPPARDDGGDDVVPGAWRHGLPGTRRGVPAARAWTWPTPSSRAFRRAGTTFRSDPGRSSL